MATRGTDKAPWSTWVSDPKRLALVGTLEDHVVGYGLARLVSVEGQGLLGVVDEVWVEAGARGVGVGEALMTSIMEWCAQAGCFGIDGEALPGDRVMKGFFERFGMSARLLVMHHRLPGPQTAR
jgi:GNAT superfamily N-acetyltransferase